MSHIPADLHYTESHEWIRQEDADTVTIGITDFAQSQLGDLVFVDLPDAGAELAKGEEACVVESVKTAADVYAPLNGEVIAVNELLADSPDKVNQDPYGDGWLFRLKVADMTKLDELLDAVSYKEQVEE
jgi:glycine cleavage system H protein